MPEIVGLPIPASGEPDWPQYVVRGDGIAAVVEDQAHKDAFLAYEFTPPAYADIAKAHADAKAKGRAAFLAKVNRGTA